MKKLFDFRVLLVLIFFLGLFFRFYRLGDVPSGFHADEASYGYNAYSLLKTGKDEYGKSFPLVLKSFGDYKPALYSYFDMPFVWAFGLTPFAVRFPAALFGSLSILLIYFLALNLKFNRKIALISSLLLSISPWHIDLSRTTSEVVISVFFIMILSFGILMLERKFSRLWLAVAILGGVLAVLSYTASRFFVVIITFLFFAFSIVRKQKYSVGNKYALYIMVILLVFGIFYSILASVNRFSQISIFSGSQTRLVLDEQIREDRNSPLIQTRIFHNKIVNYSRTVIDNFGQYFTFDFLLLKGGSPERETIPDTGLFYIWQIPFLLIGIYQAFHKKNKYGILLIAWWILALVPTSFTFDEVPNVYRTLIILPPVLITISIGIYEFFVFFKDRKLFTYLKLILIGCFIIGFYEFFYFQHQYFVHQNLHRPWYRGFAYKALVADLDKFGPSFKSIVMTKSKSSPYIYILFYDKYSPKKYQSLGSPRDLDYTGFDKYYFVPFDCPLNGGKEGTDVISGKPGVLYIDDGNCVTPKYNTKILDRIYWEDGSIAFKLMEYVSSSAQVK